MTAVAERSGFNYVQQFNATFRRVAGQTPVHVRRRYRGRRD